MSITTTYIKPQTIEEAIVLPLIATSQTTEERVTALMAEQQRELDETLSLINDLEKKDADLEREFSIVEAETERQLKEQAEEIRELNERINALLLEEEAFKVKVNDLEKVRQAEQAHLTSLRARDAFLQTPEGFLERARPAGLRYQAAEQRRVAEETRRAMEQERLNPTPRNYSENGNNR